MIRVAVSGAAGRMGRAVMAACLHDPDVVLVAALEREGSPDLGRDAAVLAGVPAEVSAGMPAGIEVTATLDISAPDVLIDFSCPRAAAAWAVQCRAASTRMVVGTTGLAEVELSAVRTAAERAAVVFAPNMSVGVNLCFGLTRAAARVLGDGADVEIVEAHHAGKRDAPSGTALRLGEIAAAAAGRDPAKAVYARARHGERVAGSIGYACIRAGDLVGEHTVLFACPGERIEIVHRASDRKIFAAGALRAAHWAMESPPGLYDMLDVLGLSADPSAHGPSDLPG